VTEQPQSRQRKLMPDTQIPRKSLTDLKKNVFIILFLVVSVLVVYWQVHGFQFISLDDPVYVTNNIQVHKGLSLESIRWAFSLSKQGEVTNWHPLTWISHMMDYQLFGLNAGMHHMVNVLLHAVNAILLFLVLRWMTGSVWKSAFVASLFALHPVNVDSVAWIAERKNLLSTIFWMLTLITYFFYTKKPNVFMYLLIIVVFCLGSLAKPMLITLPFVLLLLDYWPLGRLKIPLFSDDKAAWSSFKHNALSLILEKIPLLILSVIFIYATILSLKYSGTILASDLTPMDLKVKNALVSYLVYMGKMLWPKDLSIFYPFPDIIPLWQVMASLVVLFSITGIALRKCLKYPYFIVGWLWFLGTLVPVLGIIQAGLWPAIGERWAYIPYVGLFIIIAWGIPDLFVQLKHRTTIMIWSAMIVLMALGLRTWFQIGYWKDDFSLFSHCIQLDSDNYVAHVNLAIANALQGKSKKAIYHFQEALRIHSNDVLALDGLGRLYNKLGQYDKAIHFYTEEIRFRPTDIKANVELGSIYAAKGDTDDAIKQFSYVINLDPNHALAYYNLGVLSAKKGEMSKAIGYLTSALKLNPNDADSHCAIGIVLMNQSKANDAIAHFKEALRIDPRFLEAQNYLESALNYSQKADDDVVRLEQLRKKEPDNPDVLQKLAVLYANKGEDEKALDMLFRLIKIKPDSPNGYYNIACIFAKQGKTDKSIEWLRKSIDKGFKDWNLMKKDKDLENIRATQFYMDLIITPGK
jgi:protein O-mannosyl-transferase